MSESTIQLPDRPEHLRGLAVAAWSEPVMIDTYEVSDPDVYPEFLTSRVFQGSSGAVFPLPFFESRKNEKHPKSWQAVHLENQYVRLMILPELGGRIHIGYDKTNGYDFFYRNNVIKPALVGLTGPWISGGVEFNWPQHHRPATYLPMDHEIVAGEDGAVTVWCSDLDPMARMKGMHGIRLRPQSSLIEVAVRLFNRTDVPQTFLWWANVAAKVGDDYQSFFPTDVTMVADHAKRACATFPRASGHYYGVDYPERVDEAHPDADRLDWYKNIPVPTSYMIVDTKEDFFGGYDHAEQAGFVYWADHRVAPGKKQWTWGNAPFGWAWDRQLTDADGPYVELMAGAFTDNQPDFTYLMPGETKIFSQFWYPIQRTGPVQAATRDAAASIARDESGVRGHTNNCLPQPLKVGVAVTSPRTGVVVRLLSDGRTVWEHVVDVTPESPFTQTVETGFPIEDLLMEVEHEGKILVAARPAMPPDELVPESELPVLATPIPAPEDIDSVDELSIAARHLMQYRHATRSPLPYLHEALRRDPEHAEALLLSSDLAYRRGDFQRAKQFALTAISRLTRRNPNPFSGEAHYRCGIAMRRLGEVRESHEYLVKAAWDQAWRGAAYAIVAADEIADGRWEEAMDHVRQGLLAQSGDTRLRNMLACILMRREDADSQRAASILAETLEADPLDWWALDLCGAERGGSADPTRLSARPLDTDPQTLLDLAGEYRRVGDLRRMYELAGLAAEKSPTANPGMTAATPLAQYYQLWVLNVDPSVADVSARGDLVAHLSCDRGTCQVNRLDDVQIVQEVIDHAIRCGDDLTAHANGYALLGNWYYHVRRHADATEAWETAVKLRPADAITWRNLGVAAWNVEHDPARARAMYDKAISVRPDDPKLAYESDQLDARMGIGRERRYAWLRERMALVGERDDLTVTLADLATHCGEPDVALDLLSSREFHPWEGGEGKVLDAWESAHLERAQAAYRAGQFVEAAEEITAALNPPENLGEARHLLVNASMLWLALGDCLAAAGQVDQGRKWWEKAARFRGDFQSMSVMAYSDLTYYSILAMARLGHSEEAAAMVVGFRGHIEEQERTTPQIDYFATSLPTMLLFVEDLDAVHERYMRVLRGQLRDLEEGVDSELPQELAPTRESFLD